MNGSIVIPTYGREQVLIDTVAAVLRLTPPAAEVIVVDQTPRHADAVERQMAAWGEAGSIRWLRLSPPSTVIAMNAGLRAAGHPVVLFLDDDVVPCPGLMAAHATAFAEGEDIWAVAGQVLQPGEEPCDTPPAPRLRGLREGLDFCFRSSRPAWVSNVMAGNLSVKRERALQVGGFDANFTPPVAFRFETEFARRLIAAGGRIWFEPTASVRHLRAPTGGTRARGGHLASASPSHGVGDYYYALRWGRGWERVAYLARRPFREVLTRFHLCHPWWVAPKFLGELRALRQARRLYRQGPRLLHPSSPEAPPRPRSHPAS